MLVRETKALCGFVYEGMGNFRISDPHPYDYNTFYRSVLAAAHTGLSRRWQWQRVAFKLQFSLQVVSIPRLPGCV